MNKLIKEESEGEALLGRPLDLCEMDGGLPDGRRRPLPLSHSLPMMSDREGWFRLVDFMDYIYIDLLGLHKPQVSPDVVKTLADF